MINFLCQLVMIRMAISINCHRYLIQLNHKGVKILEIEQFFRTIFHPPTTKSIFISLFHYLQSFVMFQLTHLVVFDTLRPTNRRFIDRCCDRFPLSIHNSAKYLHWIRIATLQIINACFVLPVVYELSIETEQIFSLKCNQK